MDEPALTGLEEESMVGRVAVAIHAVLSETVATTPYASL